MSNRDERADFSESSLNCSFSAPISTSRLTTSTYATHGYLLATRQSPFQLDQSRALRLAL
jgi:hypothetical protein